MKVFISYRREDSIGHAGRLYDSLRGHFGDDGVFMDLTGIDSGRNFVDVIQGAIRSSDVLLAIIGKEWLTCAAPAGGRRLDDPTDFVRTEIAEALVRGTPVIPVLVDGISMPSQASLPEPLKTLAFHDAHNISDERWAYDIGRLIGAIEKLAGTQPRWWQRRSLVTAAAMVALLAIFGGGFFWRARQHTGDPQEAGAADARGTERLTKGDYDGAIAEYDKAIAINPLGTSYYNRGLAYFFKNDTDKAIADWNNAIKLNAGDGRAYRQRGNAFSTRGDYNLAIADYTRAIEIDQNDARAYFNRGLVYQTQGQAAKAAADFRSVVSIGTDPDAARDAQARLGDSGSPSSRPAGAAGPAGVAPRARIAGNWSADVKYDWGDKYTETFTFMVDGNEILGTASFLGLERRIVEGSMLGDRIRFEVHTEEVLGEKTSEVVHTYRGTVDGDTISFMMQSRGGSSTRPIEFAATRVSGDKPPPRRQR